MAEREFFDFTGWKDYMYLDMLKHVTNCLKKELDFEKPRFDIDIVEVHVKYRSVGTLEYKQVKHDFGIYAETLPLNVLWSEHNGDILKITFCYRTTFERLVRG